MKALIFCICIAIPPFLVGYLDPYMLWNLPTAPKGTWWKWDFISAELISDHGAWVASSVDGHAFLFACGNVQLVLQTNKEAIHEVLACGKEYIEKGNK